MFHKDKPVDWLLDHILWVKVCNPEKDQVSRSTDFICATRDKHCFVNWYVKLILSTSIFYKLFLG